MLVDDTKNGNELRATLADAFDVWDAEAARHRASCSPPVDPAVWHPIDRSIVFVHPSNPAKYWSPAQDPALRLQAHQTFGVERERWVNAIRSALDIEPAPPSAPFQALAALTSAGSLLNGSRAPDNDAESELMSVLPAPGRVFTVLALATEDASPGEADQYVKDFSGEFLGVVVPAADSSELSDCAGNGAATTPRYEALAGQAQPWPCKAPDFFGTHLWSDCSRRCLQNPIAVEAGVAQCRAMARYPGSEPCPSEFGWLDPLDAQGKRTPRVDGSGTKATRVCEVRQLEGPALTSCVTRLDCADCEPGWCATEVPELVPNQTCSTGSYYPPFRFVLGASEARDADISVVCNGAAP